MMIWVSGLSPPVFGINKTKQQISPIVTLYPPLDVKTKSKTCCVLEDSLRTQVSNIYIYLMTCLLQAHVSSD